MDAVLRDAEPFHPQPDRLPWPTAFWGVVAGWLLGLALVGLVAIAAVLLGLAPGGGAQPYPGGGLRNFPFPEGGVWSLAANGFWLVFACGACALGIWAWLSGRGRPISLLGTFAAILLAGLGPLTDGHAVRSGPLSFALAVALVRVLAARPDPWPGRLPPGRVAAAAGAAVLAWGGVAAAYGLTHPLELRAGVGGMPSPDARTQWSAHPPATVYDVVAGGTARHVFALRNRGLAGAEVAGLRLPDDAAWELTGLAAGPEHGAGLVATPVEAPLRLGGRETVWLVLELRARCSPTKWPEPLQRVLVDVELLGRRWTQPVPLIPAAAHRCAR